MALHEHESVAIIILFFWLLYIGFQKNILGGLWYGKDKPLMLTYLQPLVDQLNDLYHQGNI